MTSEWYVPIELFHQDQVWFMKVKLAGIPNRGDTIQSKAFNETQGYALMVSSREYRLGTTDVTVNCHVCNAYVEHVTTAQLESDGWVLLLNQKEA